jgi:hypothetical protein
MCACATPGQAAHQNWRSLGARSASLPGRLEYLKAAEACEPRLPGMPPASRSPVRALRDSAALTRAAIHPRQNCNRSSWIRSTVSWSWRRRVHSDWMRVISRPGRAASTCAHSPTPGQVAHQGWRSFGLLTERGPEEFSALMRLDATLRWEAPEAALDSPYNQTDEWVV